LCGWSAVVIGREIQPAPARRGACGGRHVH
jgi:hypothetical protein